MEGNSCIMCGEPIPEGRLVCSNCEDRICNSETQHVKMSHMKQILNRVIEEMKRIGGRV